MHGSTERTHTSSANNHLAMSYKYCYTATLQLALRVRGQTSRDSQRSVQQARPPAKCPAGQAPCQVLMSGHCHQGAGPARSYEAL